MTTQDVEQKTNEFLSQIGSGAVIKVEQQEEGFGINIDGVDMNYLIGYKGESLEAFQHILSHALFNKYAEWPKIRVDINGYKAAKLEKVEEMVKNIIDRVRFHQKGMRLPYLNSFERRHIHNFISEYMDVKSESRGEGPERRLYILPVQNDNQ